jgi:hypothetical protein
MTKILIVLLLIIQITYSLCYVNTINNRRIIINSPIINKYDNNKLVLQNNRRITTTITTVYSNNGDYIPVNPINTIPTKSLDVSNDDKKKTKTHQVILSFLYNNWLVLGEVLVIYLAKQNPHFFKSGGALRPEFWISKVGVFVIFFINGIALSISTDDLQSASKTNAIILSYNFAFLPLFAKAFSQFYPDPAFRDGLLVLSVLPTTINILILKIV